jgi:hypothetical protein
MPPSAKPEALACGGHHPRDLSTSRASATYLCFMNLVRRALEIDAETDARFAEIAAERGQDVATVLAEAVALLDFVVDLAGPDVGEDRQRLDAFRKTG